MSTTATSLPKFDVFLSFRGLDTRRNFISFLYKELVRRNIRTFKDDKELESGRRISSELERVIEESKFAVVVISVNYPASAWCLDELVKIMDFENKGSLIVMPIFYGVDPSHLRRQIGEVAEQFKKHEARVDHEKVLSWRQALTNLASISGDCSWKWEDESKLVDEITERISNMLTATTTAISNMEKMQRRQNFRNVWHTDLKNSIHGDTLYCCFALWCAPCASYLLRKRALYNDMSRYTCCAGYMPCSGKCGETKCPQLCLATEVFCCFGTSVASTRFLLRDEFQIQTTHCDYCIFFIMSIVGFDELSEASQLLCCLADMVYCTVCACMQTQHKVEMDRRDGKFGPQPMAMPPAQQMSRF